MINVAYRNTPWSERTIPRQFMPGATVQEIVDSFDKPIEFASHGGVYLQAPGDEFGQGQLVDRQHWHRVRPKDGAGLFISLVPQGGGGGNGGGGKNIFAVVGAIALVALTAWLTAGGGLALLAPSVFGAGVAGSGIATAVAAAAISVAGSSALALLSKPSAGRPAAIASSDIGSGAGVGAAGISQNTLAAYQQVPGVRARALRVSPPLLARPFTTVENTDQVLNMIVGVCGPCSIDDIKINDTDIADLLSGMVEFETREGFDDDALLTLVTESAFEENINLQMSAHRLDSDQSTLIAPYSGSYPRPYIARSARNTKRFRWTLNFSQGLVDYGSSANVAAAFRLRIRAVGESTWINLPEMLIAASRNTAFRQEIWLHWGDAGEEDEFNTGTLNPSALFNLFYYKNSEWQANSYFDDSGSGSVISAVRHVYSDADKVDVFLDQDAFPRGQYDVEITHGFIDAASNETSSVYTGGMFTRRTTSGSVESIPNQKGRTTAIGIENYCSFRDEYPIAERNMALICIKARNLQVSSLSAVFGSYVNIWDGADWDTVAVSGNPAALDRDVLIGSLNKRRIAEAKLDPADWSGWYTHCVNQSLECNHIVTEGSVERIGDLVAACGDALLRRSDKWGVVVDRDRSDEAMAGAFHPGNMTQPLVVTKTFITGARALVPHIHDEARDFAERDLDRPVFDDGVAATEDTLIESAQYDGITSEALAIRRAVIDLRRARLRTRKYTWGVHLSHLKCRKGSIVGLAHDILVDTFGFGRVMAFQKDGSGNIVSVTMNTNFSDLPVTGYDDLFDVENVYTLSEFFTLRGPAMGLQIELPDASVVTIPISGVDDRTLIVDGTVASPSGLKSGCLAALGRRDRETRRVILTGIAPKNDFFAQLEAVDAAPEIFDGY